LLTLFVSMIAFTNAPATTTAKANASNLESVVRKRRATKAATKALIATHIACERAR